MAAELQAIQDGLRFWELHRPGPIRILSDSIDDIHSIRNMKNFKGVEEDLINTLDMQLKDPLVEGVWYCQCKENVLAHTLAKRATKSPHPQAWVGDDIPRQILSLARDT